MKTILVPTDFSAPAKTALQYAIAIAKKANAQIIILHLYHIPITPGRVPYVPDPASVKENLHIATQQLKELEDGVEGLNLVDYSTKTIPMYWTAEFAEIIQAQNADLTIMGTEGASGLKKFVLGSNTATVIDSAVRPVLAIPKQAISKPVKNIAFAYDGGLIEDMGALDFLVSFAKLFNAQVQIFHVKQQGGNKEDDAQHSNKQKLINYLGPVYHSYSECYEDNVEDGMNKYIDDKQIDILAIMPRNHSMFHRLFKGSHTKKMAFQTSTALLVIPEK